jgi:hypothetical protein
MLVGDLTDAKMGYRSIALGARHEGRHRSNSNEGHRRRHLLQLTQQGALRMKSDLKELDV